MAKLCNAVKEVKDMVQYQSLYYRLSFEYDDFMEKMIDKAKLLKKIKFSFESDYCIFLI